MIGRIDQLAAQLRDRLDAHGYNAHDLEAGDLSDIADLLTWIALTRSPIHRTRRALDAALTCYDPESASAIVTGWIAEEAAIEVSERLVAALQALKPR